MLNQLLGCPKIGALPRPAAWEGTWESFFSLSLLLLSHSQVWVWGKGLESPGSSFFPREESEPAV